MHQCIEVFSGFSIFVLSSCCPAALNFRLSSVYISRYKSIRFCSVSFMQIRFQIFISCWALNVDLGFLRSNADPDPLSLTSADPDPEMYWCGQGCGSVFIFSGSGSRSLCWRPIRIRIRIHCGSRALMTKNWKKITAENFFIFFFDQKLPFTYP